ncbi:MAG: alpha/beta hydrolase [Thermosynechococcaceae cyanobacterium]
MPQITIGDVNINYKIQGNGLPLLMIIGFSFSLLDWGTELPDLLAPHYQLILFDNRDAGLTSLSRKDYNIADMADDTVGLLNALNIPKAHIFGVSMGGAIAQALALKYPSKVDKLILGCTFAGGTCSEYGNFNAFLNGNLLDLLFTPSYIQAHQQTLDDHLANVRPFHSKGGALQRQLQALTTHNTCDTLSTLTAQTLIITGDSDLVIPPSNSTVLVNKIAKAQLAIISDAAHGFSFSHADQTAQLIHNFLT